MSEYPLIFDIQRSSFEDGSGIRTVVFFKGCPLRCKWCHNPESQSINRELLWYRDLCTNCMSCKEVCSNNAIINEKINYKIDKNKCKICGECEKTCNYNAIKIAGNYFNSESLINLILRDRIYFCISGGGVTFSGGEPLMFLDYLSVICRVLKNEGINIAIQTCGYFDFDKFDKLISNYIDTVYFDLKIADKDLHLKLTGKSNDLILYNLNKLFSPKKHKVIIRTLNSNEFSGVTENLENIKTIIHNYNYDGFEELIYNNSYENKIKALGR